MFRAAARDPARSRVIVALVSTRGEILTFPDTLTTQGLSLWSLNIVGGEILTFPDTLTTQGLSLWSLNIVGGEILTFPDTLTTQGLSL